MNFDKLTDYVTGLARHLFEGSGEIIAFAIMDRPSGLGTYNIASGKSDADAVRRFNKIVRDNGITSYAVIYEGILAGGKEEAKMLEEGHVFLDHVTPVGDLTFQELADAAANSPEKAIFIVMASVDGERKTLFLPVTGERELGPERDVTDQVHSPFAEVYGVKPFRPSL
jgi:hypothetical protein